VTTGVFGGHGVSFFGGITLGAQDGNHVYFATNGMAGKRRL
jgi:hypothetical protein